MGFQNKYRRRMGKLGPLDGPFMSAAKRASAECESSFVLGGEEQQNDLQTEGGEGGLIERGAAVVAKKHSEFAPPKEHRDQTEAALAQIALTNRATA
jgi:hypothetical protein